ncbi:MAG: adenosylcobinamide-GDP ribazoletransferase [Pseudomonadota bacterium]
MKSEGASFLLAVQFLTRLPVDTAKLYSPNRMANAIRYYPLVGGLVGGASAGVFLLADTVFPAALSVLFAMAAGLLITGAFHEDGLADTFDGIGGGLTRETALQIMKDSRLGTYGTLALITALAIKFAALIAIPQTLIPLAFIVAHGLSRLSSVLVIATSEYVRGEGTAKPVAEAASATSLVIALVSGALLIGLWSIWLPLFALISGLVGLLIGHGLMRLFFERKLGGYTGDTLGAVQQASEIGFYLGVLAWL